MKQIHEVYHFLGTSVPAKHLVYLIKTLHTLQQATKHYIKGKINNTFLRHDKGSIVAKSET